MVKVTAYYFAQGSSEYQQESKPSTYYFIPWVNTNWGFHQQIMPKAWGEWKARKREGKQREKPLERGSWQQKCILGQMYTIGCIMLKVNANFKYQSVEICKITTSIQTGIFMNTHLYSYSVYICKHLGIFVASTTSLHTLKVCYFPLQAFIF